MAVELHVCFYGCVQTSNSLTVDIFLKKVRKEMSVEQNS